jgi:hypothetical protein
MPRLVLIAALTLVAALASASTVSAAEGPAANAARGCGVGNTRGYGPTYLLKLSVSHTSCRNGKRLVRAYYNCRKSHGGRKGHCSGVLGYRCSEHRFDKIPSQFSARVSCSKGSRHINHTYEQFT